MSGIREVEEGVNSALQHFGRKLKKRMTMRDEERLLVERRRKRQAHQKHLHAYLIVNVALFLFFWFVARGSLQPSMLVALWWGVGLAFHTLGHYRWRKDHAHELQEAETWVRLEERKDLYFLLEGSPEALASPLPAGQDPILTRCEAAAQETRDALAQVGSAEKEALAVVEEGLDRVRELIGHRPMLRKALEEADPAKLEGERARLRERIEGSSDPDARALYESQLELLEARATKIKGLSGLLERIEAYAESYLASLTNLRMDAAHLRAADVPPGTELAQLTRPLKRLEEQMEGMRRASAEVARVVTTSSRS